MSLNHQQIAHAKELISFGHDIAYRAKLIEHHNAKMNKAASPATREKSYRASVELLAEIVLMSNTIYHSGMDRLKNAPSKKNNI